MLSCALFQRVRRPILGNIHRLRPGEVFARSPRKALGFFWAVGGKGHPGQDLGLLTVILRARHQNSLLHKGDNKSHRDQSIHAGNGDTEINPIHEALPDFSPAQTHHAGSGDSFRQKCTKVYLVVPAQHHRTGHMALGSVSSVVGGKQPTPDALIKIGLMAGADPWCHPKQAARCGYRRGHLHRGSHGSAFRNPLEPAN